MIAAWIGITEWYTNVSSSTTNYFFQPIWLTQSHAHDTHVCSVGQLFNQAEFLWERLYR